MGWQGIASFHRAPVEVAARHDQSARRSAQMLEFSEACERNKSPILAVLAEAFDGAHDVFEIGSGTGQHAVHFASRLPQLSWQPSDVAANLPALRARIDAEGPANLSDPVEFDVTAPDWPALDERGKPDAIFSANTLHIMSWPAVECCFAAIGRLLAEAGTVCIYGPFRYRGRFTTTSNERFDSSLRRRDPDSGIRDFEAIRRLAAAERLRLTADHAMPANNQLLVFRRD